MVEDVYTRGVLSSGEHHMFKDHLFSRDIHAVRKVNSSLIEAKARVAAPRQAVAQLAQLPRDPKTNRSSYGHIAVYLAEQKVLHGSVRQERQLRQSLHRAVSELQRSFGDRLVSVRYELCFAERADSTASATVQQHSNRMPQPPPKMVLSKEGEWVLSKPVQQEQARPQTTLQQEPARQQWWCQTKPTREIPAQQVPRIHFQSFLLIYRALGKDEKGLTVGGGINSDRQLLELGASQPCLTGHQLHDVIKEFAACLQ